MQEIFQIRNQFAREYDFIQHVSSGNSSECPKEIEEGVKILVASDPIRKVLRSCKLKVFGRWDENGAFVVEPSDGLILSKERIEYERRRAHRMFPKAFQWIEVVKFYSRHNPTYKSSSPVIQNERIRQEVLDLMADNFLRRSIQSLDSEEEESGFSRVVLCFVAKNLLGSFVSGSKTAEINLRKLLLFEEQLKRL